MSGLEFIIFGIFKALATKAGVAAVAHAPAPVLMHGAQQVVSTAVSSGSLASGAHTLYHGVRFGYKVLKCKKRHGLTANGQKIGKDINEAKIDREIRQAGGNEEQLMAAACAWVLEDDYAKRGNLNRNGKKKISLEEMKPCQECRCPDFSGFDIADDSECADCGCDASSHNSNSKNKMERTIWAFAFEHYEDMENRDEKWVFKIHLEDIDKCGKCSCPDFNTTAPFPGSGKTCDCGHQWYQHSKITPDGSDVDALVWILLYTALEALPDLVSKRIIG